jgi:hypothetical protein
VVSKTAFFPRKGRPEGADCVRDCIVGAAGRVGNPHSCFDEGGVGWAGVAPVSWRSALRSIFRVGDLVDGGLGFLRGDGIARLVVLQLFAKCPAGTPP